MQLAKIILCYASSRLSYRQFTLSYISKWLDGEEQYIFKETPLKRMFLATTPIAQVTESSDD
jgi:hypothetical protein